MKKSSVKRLPKNGKDMHIVQKNDYLATVAAMIAPALMIDATAMSVWSTPIIGVNMVSKQFIWF